MDKLPNLFDGETIVPDRDNKPLLGQLKNIRQLMLDKRWRTLEEISKLLAYPPSSISARLRDLRKPRFGSYTVNRRLRSGRLFEYQLAAIEPPQRELLDG